MNTSLGFFVLTLKKDFSAFCNQKLQEIGMTQGLLYFIIYIGKHPGCSMGSLIKDLHMDWGYTQRSIEKLQKDGFVIKQKSECDKRVYCLSLTPAGENAFSVSYQVIYDWDANVLGGLSAMEKQQLFTILEKLEYKEGEYGYVRND